jgi:predicted GNAT family acetyltransferase
MIRLATSGDTARLAGFLGDRVETSMFLLGNLEMHGIGASEHPHATTYVLAETDGQIAGVLGCSTDGFLMVQAPRIDAALASQLLAPLAGRRMAGITGDAAQVAAVLQALGLPPSAWRLNESQPLYRLDLAALVPPEVVLRAPGPEDRAGLTEWFVTYMAETGTAPEGDLDAAATARAEAAIAGDHVRLLIEGGAPVAMSAINARAGTVVQVGGVFVPLVRRGAGRGGAVVAAHLALERAGGADLAILFAATPGAARTYERIGFRRIGDYRVALLSRALTLGGVAA